MAKINLVLLSFVLIFTSISRLQAPSNKMMIFIAKDVSSQLRLK